MLKNNVAMETEIFLCTVIPQCCGICQKKPANIYEIPQHCGMTVFFYEYCNKNNILPQQHLNFK